MRRNTRLVGIIGAAVLMLAVAVPVMARDGDVTRTGACTNNSDWKLKAGHRDGRIELEFEVDQNRIGKTWRVRLSDNGTVFFRGWRTTKAPSGSFTVEKSTANRAGTDRIVGRAVNPKTGEICRGVVRI